MSSLVGPSNQSTLFDYSRNETTYGNYTNMGQHGGVINIGHQTTNYQSSRSSPLDELRKHCSPSAAFNSAARFDPPRCAESTRLRIIRVIEEWKNNDADDASIFWLYGGAGAGKSALAQSVSEKFQKKGLAASFFFFRSDSTRNNGGDLIPTLVSQLVSHLKELAPFVEDQIAKHWDIFTKTYNIQIKELLLVPLLLLKSANAISLPPCLVVVDGLDECSNPDVQCLLLRAIANALPDIPYPFRFLITSRPEAHIAHVFNHDPAFQTIPVQRYNLSDDPDADMDIRKFLETGFLDLRKVHRLGEHLPHTWPDQQAISSLVERSSGHFIFASTVIRYVQSPKHRPDDRLEVILRLQSPQEGDQPYAQLDALYGLIFGCVESRVQLEKICLVLGILYFQSKECGFLHTARDCTTIEKILGMKAGNLVLLLDPILSLIAIDGNNPRIYHKTLYDYLLDFDRGGHLPFDLCRVHETAATYILTEKIANAACDLSDFEHFAFHCQYGYLSNTLKDYLSSLEVPCPKFLITTIEAIPWKPDLNFVLRQLMWRLFRTMSREDFDSTGRIYEQYMRKWITHLEPSPPPSLNMDSLKVWFNRRLQKLSVQSEDQVLNAEMNDTKYKLDKLLMEWKPKISHRRDTRPVRLDYIKQEHHTFSAHFKAIFPENANGIASSLVFGDDFIHSFTFTLWDGGWPMVVHTYSKHEYASFHTSWQLVFNTADAMNKHLNNIEKRLASDHFIKYGLND